jgi:superfamily II DNA helicase RecQ
MKIEFFHIPAFAYDESVAKLNSCIARQRVTNIEKHFVANGDNSFWAVAVTIADGNGEAGDTARRMKIDYRQVLSAEEFTVYARLRELRKRIAESEATPAYNVFTNEQLAAMVRRRLTGIGGLREIDGVGQGRVEKYGEAFVTLLRECYAAADDETAAN